MAFWMQAGREARERKAAIRKIDEAKVAKLKAAEDARKTAMALEEAKAAEIKALEDARTDMTLC